MQAKGSKGKKERFSFKVPSGRMEKTPVLLIAKLILVEQKMVLSKASLRFLHSHRIFQYAERYSFVNFNYVTHLSRALQGALSSRSHGA